MVLSTIDEGGRPPSNLSIQTRFPKPRPSHGMPYSTRNIANATEPLSTTSIVFSMEKANKKMFFDHHADGEGFGDIFRRWEDGGSVKSRSSDSYSGRRKERPSDNMSDVSSVSRKGKEGIGGISTQSQSYTRRPDKTDTIPRMEDWMNDKLDKYQSFQSNRMELTPPPKTDTVRAKSVVNPLPLPKKRLEHNKSSEQRDESDTTTRGDHPTTTTTSSILPSKLDIDHTINYYRAMGQNESLQNKLSEKQHEIDALQHRLNDMEKWYQGRMEDMETQQRNAQKAQIDQLDRMRKEREEELRHWKNREATWMEEKMAMNEEIALLRNEASEAGQAKEENDRLSNEVRGCKLEIERLTKENFDAVANVESMERDLAYHKNEKEHMEEERQREKESHQAMVVCLAEEKKRAFHDANDWKLRQKEVHDAMLVKMKQEHNAEMERVYHELNDWKARAQSATRELDEASRIESQQLQSMKRELEAEMARNAALSKDKNDMADMLDNSVTKMEHMQRQIMELEKQKIDLMVNNSELEAGGTRVNMLVREKTMLEGTMEEYRVHVAELQRKNQELERETMSLKQELIDVLEAASHYQ